MLSQPGGARRAVPALCPQPGAGWNQQRQNLALRNEGKACGPPSMNAPLVGGEQEEF